MSRQVRQCSDGSCSDEGSFDHADEGDDDGQEQHRTGTKTITNGESQTRVSFSRHRRHDHVGSSLSARSQTIFLRLARARHDISVSRELEQRGNSVLKDGTSRYAKLINGAKLISWIYERYCVYDRTM